MPASPFSKVREAREAIKAKSLALFELHMKLIKTALDTGDLEEAGKNIRWLSEHMPSEDDGTTMLSGSVDNGTGSEKSSGPTIQIGFQLGGVPVQKALPEPEEAPIDVEVIETHE